MVSSYLTLIIILFLKIVLLIPKSITHTTMARMIGIIHIMLMARKGGMGITMHIAPPLSLNMIFMAGLIESARMLLGKAAWIIIMMKYVIPPIIYRAAQTPISIL